MNTPDQLLQEVRAARQRWLRAEKRRRETNEERLYYEAVARYVKARDQQMAADPIEKGQSNAGADRQD